MFKSTSAILLVISSTASMASDFSCFTNFTRGQAGLVEEESFVPKKVDSVLQSDGYITSFNLDKMLKHGKPATAEMAFGRGILYKDHKMDLTFIPYIAENPQNGDKRITRIGISVAGVKVSVDLKSNQNTTLEFKVPHGKESYNVSLECGLLFTDKTQTNQDPTVNSTDRGLTKDKDIQVPVEKAKSQPASQQ